MPTLIRRRLSSRETDTTGRTVGHAVRFETMRLSEYQKTGEV
jgi:hypothetical protein